MVRPARSARGARGRVLLVAGAATRPSVTCPRAIGGWPHWMAGPLEGLGVGISGTSFQVWVLIMCAGYLAVLLAARALPLRVARGARSSRPTDSAAGPAADLAGRVRLPQLRPPGRPARPRPLHPRRRRSAHRPVVCVHRAGSDEPLPLRPAVHARELRARAAGARRRAVGAEGDRRLLRASERSPWSHAPRSASASSGAGRRRSWA